MIDQQSRQILRHFAESLLRNIDDPNADLRTLLKQMEQIRLLIEADESSRDCNTGAAAGTVQL